MSADNYIMIQPLVNTKWVAQMGWMSSDTAPDPTKAHESEIYDTFEEALQQNAERARETEYGFQIFETPVNENLIITDDTLAKVYSAFIKAKVLRSTAIKVVHLMQEEGIVFRERVKSP